MSNQYDNARHQVRQLLPIADTLGFVVNTTGTNAADVPLFRFRVPRKITVDEGTLVCQTAATVAVATAFTVAIQKSVAGTGSLTTVGSVNIAGTTASGTGQAFTVTSTDFAAGDHLALVLLAGTTANAGGYKGQVVLGWKETFPSTADPSTSG